MQHSPRPYRIGELAERAGVSVRTLHHYDRLGLVTPSGRSEAGYRLYAEADLLRLQQVLTLRYLGFPLKRIVELLDRPGFDVAASLRAQRRGVEERLAELRRIHTAISRVLDAGKVEGAWDSDLVLDAAAAVGAGTNNRSEDMEKYYTPEQMKQFEELRNETPAEEIKAVEEEWAVLLAEVRAAHSLDPSSAEAKAIAARWDELLGRTMSYYAAKPGLIEAMGRNYAAGSFEETDGAPKAGDLEFIRRVKGA